MELILIAVLAFAMMWWMSRRSKKQRAEAMSFRDSLEAGQEVMTGSGLFGVITEVDEDRITLESGGADGSRSVWLRAAIAKLIDPPVDPDLADDEATDDMHETLAGISDATEQQEVSSEQPDEDDQIK